MSVPHSAQAAPNAATDGSAANLPSQDEVARIRRRRRLARKTPEQRRKLLQYQRRHNEKDGRLAYCDYCDLFVSSRQRPWRAHLQSTRHMEAFRAYYNLAVYVESAWMGEISHKIELARSREVHRVQQASAGQNAATPLPVQCVAPGIKVGGTPVGPATRPPPPPPVLNTLPATLPSIRVGGKVIVGPPANAGQKKEGEV